LLSIVF
jgi:hypothetical protein